MLKRFMGSVILLGFTILFAAGFAMNQNSTSFLAGNTRDVVRLHVVANSDTQYDQMLKLKVRDAIIAYMTPKLQQTDNAKQATSIVLNNRQEIESVARKVLLLSGVDYPVKVEYGQFEFPTKNYGDLVYPAGQYNAVRILLGQAAGANWWCVLFPPLCFIDENNNFAIKAALATDDKVNSKKVEFRWKLQEFFSQ